MRSCSQRKAGAKAEIDRIIRSALGLVVGRDDETKTALGRLLRHVRHRSGLLRPPRAGSQYDPKGYDIVLNGLLSLAFFHRDWLRPVETWEPDGGNPRPQFSSLARHLLAAYPVPAFMTSVWFGRTTPEA